MYVRVYVARMCVFFKLACVLVLQVSMCGMQVHEAPVFSRSKQESEEEEEERRNYSKLTQ